MPSASEQTVDVVPEDCVVPHPPRTQIAVPRPVGLLEDSAKFSLLSSDDGLGLIVAVTGAVSDLHPSLAASNVHAIVTNRGHLLCALLSSDPKYP